MEVISENFNV